MNSVDFSFLIPVENAEHKIKLLTETLLSYGTDLNLNFELLFLDNVSNDNTLNLLFDIRSQFDGIKIITQKRKKIYHDLLACGIVKASGNYCIALDHDLQSDLSKVKSLLSKTVDQSIDLILIDSYRDVNFVTKLVSQIILFVSNYFTTCYLPFRISHSFLVGNKLKKQLVREIDRPGNIINKAIKRAKNKVYLELNLQKRQFSQFIFIKSQLYNFFSRIFCYSKISKKTLRIVSNIIFSICTYKLISKRKFDTKLLVTSLLAFIFNQLLSSYKILMKTKPNQQYHKYYDFRGKK
jgi:hypothetical protein